MAWRGKLGRGEARWVEAVVVRWRKVGRGRVSYGGRGAVSRGELCFGEARRVSCGKLQ